MVELPRFTVELIVCNLAPPRRETIGGREYLVASATSIVPGVLNGSKGPLFYPPQFVEQSVPTWNEVPLVVFHPNVMGKYVSAAAVPDKHVGVLRNTSFDGKLRHECWFDVVKLAKVSPDVLRDLKAGKPIEVSTGLYTNNIDLKGTHDGRPYVQVATGYRPDHLAVLPGQIGACSIRDGCGLNVNMVRNSAGWTDEARAASIAARKATFKASNFKRPAQDHVNSVLSSIVRSGGGEAGAQAHDRMAKIHSQGITKSSKPNEHALAMQAHTVAAMVLRNERAVKPVKAKVAGSAEGSSAVESQASKLAVNAWNDAAREAAAAARVGKAQGGKAGDASHTAGLASRTATNFVGTSHEKAFSKSAADAHTKAAELHEAVGNRTAAAKHRTAAKAYVVNFNMTHGADGKFATAESQQSTVSRIAGKLGDILGLTRRSTVENDAAKGLAGLAQAHKGIQSTVSAKNYAHSVVVQSHGTDKGAIKAFHQDAAKVHLQAAKAHRTVNGGKTNSYVKHHMEQASIHMAAARSPGKLVGNARWPQSKRDKLPTKDFAGPNQSFPIRSQKDVDSAAKLAGHADDPAAVRAKIISIAKRKGLALPEAWK